MNVQELLEAVGEDRQVIQYLKRASEILAHCPVEGEIKTAHCLEEARAAVDKAIEMLVFGLENESEDYSQMDGFGGTGDDFGNGNVTGFAGYSAGNLI